MLQILSGTSRRTLAWFAIGTIVILLAAFWLFSDRKLSTSRPPDQKLTQTVFRKKIVQPRKSADPTVSKKAAAVKIPEKPQAVIKTQQTPETKTTVEPSAPIITAPPEQEEPVAPEPTIAAAPKTASQPKPEPQAAAKPTPKTDSQPQTGLRPAPKPTPKIPGPVTPKTAARQIRRERWLLSQDADSYTIQIIGVSNEQSMLDFINRNKLLKQNEIAYYESTYNGKPWYQALFGLYPTKQEARRAADKLPEDIRRAGPWIRRLSEVQQAIVN